MPAPHAVHRNLCSQPPGAGASGLPGPPLPGPLASEFSLQAHLQGAGLAGGRGGQGQTSSCSFRWRVTLSAGALVPTSPGIPWTRGGNLSAKPLETKPETPPPVVLLQPTWGGRKGAWRTTLPLRKPRELNKQGAKGSAQVKS